MARAFGRWPAVSAVSERVFAVSAATGVYQTHGGAAGAGTHGYSVGVRGGAGVLCLGVGIFNIQ